MGWVDFKKLYREAGAIIDEFKLPIKPTDRVRDLPVAYQQMVEIIKSYRRNPKILAFDEPTASLSDAEIDILFTIIERLRKKGMIILYVSHRMKEILQITDKLIIMKDGKYVETLNTKDTNEKEIVKRMVGRSLGGQGMQIELLNHRLESIRSNFEAKNYRKVEEDIDFIYQKDLPGMMQCHYLHHMNTLLLGLFTFICFNHHIPYIQVFGSETISIRNIEQQETVAGIHDWYVEKFNRIICLIDESVTYSVRVKKTIAIMERHYQSDISMEEIAEELGLHKVSLGRIFKDETGKSLNTYLNQIRVDKAKTMLKDPEFRINDIIYQTGFNNPQSFYYIFKQMTGMTPKEYREGNRGKRGCNE